MNWNRDRGIEVGLLCLNFVNLLLISEIQSNKKLCKEMCGKFEIKNYDLFNLTKIFENERLTMWSTNSEI